MKKTACKCQCMDCAHSQEMFTTRSCAIMTCVTKHCSDCRQVMAKCTIYITPEELKQEQEKLKRQKAAGGR